MHFGEVRFGRRGKVAEGERMARMGQKVHLGKVQGLSGGKRSIVAGGKAKPAKSAVKKKKK